MKRAYHSDKSHASGCGLKAAFAFVNVERKDAWEVVAIHFQTERQLFLARTVGR